MQDLIFLTIPIAFFALCVAYVRGLDRLVRSSEEGGRSSGLADTVDLADAELAGAQS